MISMTDKKPILDALNQAMRTLDPDRSATRHDPAIDGPIMERLLSLDGFLLGESHKIGYLKREWVHFVLRALDRARRASVDARRGRRPDPVSIVRIGIDWGRIRFEGGDGPALDIRMPLVLGGHWIGRDRGLLMDTASLAVLDAAGVHIPRITHDELVRRMNRAGALAKAITSVSRDESYHVVLPSPFGPAQMRCHDSTGVPYASFDPPEADELRDLPHAYEIGVHADESLVSIEIRRARCFDARTYGEAGNERHSVSEARAACILSSMSRRSRGSTGPEDTITGHPTKDDLADAYERHEVSKNARRRHGSCVERAATAAADAVREAALTETLRLDAETEAAKLEMERIRTAISRRNPLVGRKAVVPAVPAKSFSRGKSERIGIIEVYAPGDPHSSSRAPDIGQLVLRISRADGTPGLGVIAIDHDVLPDGWRLSE